MDNLGWIAFREDGDLAKAAYYYEQALMLDPSNTDIIGNASMLLSAIGQSDKALQLAEYQVSRDPANALAYNNLGIRYRYIGKYKQAREALSRTLTLNPKFIGAEYEIGATLLLEGDYTNAAKAFGREPHAVFTNIGMAMTYYGLGEISRSFELTNELIGSYGEPLAYYLAQIMAFRGENDDAFEWLEKAYLANDGEMAYIIVEPLLNNLHTDKRWIPFLESIGKSPAQLADIKFNTKIPD